MLGFGAIWAVTIELLLPQAPEYETPCTRQRVSGPFWDGLSPRRP